MVHGTARVVLLQCVLAMDGMRQELGTIARSLQVPLDPCNAALWEAALSSATIPLSLCVPIEHPLPPSSPQRMTAWFPAPCARSHRSPPFLCALLGEQRGACQPQGAWQRVMAKLPAACRVIPAMRGPWSASRECRRSSSEAVQLAMASKQDYTSLSSKRAHSASLGTVRLREEGWVGQCLDERHHPVPGTGCRLTLLVLTFLQGLYAKPGAPQNPRWRETGF